MKLSGEEYDRRIVALHKHLPPVPSPEQQRQVRKSELDLAIDHKRPAAPATCDNPVEKNLQLGRQLGVNSTPTLFLANGERLSGGLALNDLKELLDQPATARR